MFKLSKRGLSSCLRQDIAILTSGISMAVGLTLAATASSAQPSRGALLSKRRRARFKASRQRESPSSSAFLMLRRQSAICAGGRPSPMRLGKMCCKRRRSDLTALRMPIMFLRAQRTSQMKAAFISMYSRTAPFYFPPLLDFESLAYHTADIQYLFPLFHGGPAPPSVIHVLNAKQEILSDQLVAAWTNFAWTGNPNGRAYFLWPRYLGGDRNSRYLLENIAPAGLSTQTDAQFVARHNCNFWDSYLTP